jgi:hypothetical protein
VTSRCERLDRGGISSSGEVKASNRLSPLQPQSEPTDSLVALVEDVPAIAWPRHHRPSDL